MATPLPRVDARAIGGVAPSRDHAHRLSRRSSVSCLFPDQHTASAPSRRLLEHGADEVLRLPLLRPERIPARRPTGPPCPWSLCSWLTLPDEVRVPPHHANARMAGAACHRLDRPGAWPNSPFACVERMLRPRPGRCGNPGEQAGDEAEPGGGVDVAPAVIRIVPGLGEQDGRIARAVTLPSCAGPAGVQLHRPGLHLAPRMTVPDEHRPASCHRKTSKYGSAAS